MAVWPYTVLNWPAAFSAIGLRRLRTGDVLLSIFLDCLPELSGDLCGERRGFGA